MVSFTVDPNYFFVLIAMAATCFHIFLVGFRVSAVRSKLFNKEFFDKNFPGQFKESFPKGGYPDMGNGYYSQKLSYEEWLLFNTTQRSHLNYLEAAPGMLVYEAIAGLFFPRFTLATALLFIVGRQLYATGYTGAAGPKGRGFGGLLAFVAQILTFGAAVYGAFTAAGGLPALKALCTF